MNFFRSPIVRGSALLILVLLIGVFGFYWIEENYSLFDSLYMTVITLSTVGYSEVGNLSEEGKVFTVLFILIGFITVAIALRFIVEYLISDWSLQALKQKKNMNMIKELTQHTIVCGFGRTGRQAVARLKRHRQPYVVIEQDEKLIESWKANVLFQRGSALTEACLHSSGIKKAKHLISALPDDAKNLFVVLTARKLNPALTIVSRVCEEVNQSKLKWAGADHIIMPDKIGRDYMAALLTVPDLIYFLGALNWWEKEAQPNIEEISLNKIPSKFQQKSLAELALRKVTGCNVIGYRNEKGNLLVNPDSELILSAKGKLIILGSSTAIKKLNQMFQLD